ncbi:MAG: hypothetical protein ACO1TE_18210 [Prosthecobacter sp.]
MNEAPPEPAADSALVQAQIGRMDALLAAGRAAMARVDKFYEEHGLQPGFGARKLQGEEVPERHRIIFARILAEFPMIEQRIEEQDPRRATPAAVPVRARAVGNRYRI